MEKKASAHHNKNLKWFVITFSGFAGAILFFIIAVPALFPPAGEEGSLVPVAIHKHAYLTVKVDGKEEKIPENVGIADSLYHDHSLDQYGVGNGHAPIHTHDDRGLIHVEAAGDNTENNAFTVGKFLDIWGYEIPEGAQVGLLVGYKEQQGFLSYYTYVGSAVPYRDHVFADGDSLILEVYSQ